MNDTKGFELALSTIVILALCMLLLIGLVYVLTDGFARFRGATAPILSTEQASALKAACELACTNADREHFCENKTVKGSSYRCDDARLNVTCEKISCG